jgi:hypothetical protein
MGKNVTFVTFFPADRISRFSAGEKTSGVLDREKSSGYLITGIIIN